MKFLKKAIKKVFKPIKKFAKSTLGKVALTIGATFFTAGLGTVGFGAFKGAQGVAGILGAVGKTTAAGAQGLLGALGIGSGVSANLAGQIQGAEAGQTLFGVDLFDGGTAAVSTGGMPGSPEHIRNMTNAALSQSPNQSNILNGVNGMFNGYGGLMLARGVMGGVQAYFQNEQWEQQQEIVNRRNWFGDRARGGGTAGAPLINFEGTGPLERLPNYASSDQADEDLIRDPSTEAVPEVEIDPLSRRRNLIGIA